MRSLDPPQAVARARAGDRLALGRLISAVEERSDTAAAIGRELPPGHAHVVGITGAPGVGKSTTTAALIGRWRDAGLAVAVLAVDPSSPFTGGALLGDRVRMGDHATDDGVFIRSMAARGQLGGLSAATPAAIRVLAGCGFDVIVVETVGVGQSEVDIVRYADTVVILQAPGMGDRVQATKAGLLEIGDVFAVNKSDRPGADATRRELVAMVSAKPIPEGGWRPPVVAVTASTGAGIDDLVAAIADHRAFAEASGAASARRRARVAAEIRGLALGQVDNRIAAASSTMGDLVESVLSGRRDPRAAAEELLAGLHP
ncbi:MAG: methylmalonyl Co-A mutase-associated GTPase MeaB [Candidatus Nanopelagicales bacterium]